MIAPPDFSVAGKQILISGGTGDIATAFANAFLHYGAEVIACDLAPPKQGMDKRIKYG